MPTALEVHSSLRDFLAGRDPGVVYRAGPNDRDQNGNLFRMRYDGGNIVGNESSGSQNYGPMAGSNAVVYHYHRQNWNEVNKILDAWAEYAKLQYLTSEVFCCNIYIAFITVGVIAAARVAVLMGRHDLATALLRHARTGAILQALSSGWKKNRGGFGGYPVMMCGARSFSGVIDYELTGNTFASAGLMYWTGMENPPAKSMDAAIQEFAKTKNIWNATTQERDVLTNIIKNRLTPERLKLCVQWLEEGPGFAADAAIIRTDSMVAWCLIGPSINTGSTNWLPGKAWHSDRAPNPRWGMGPEWGICTVDYPRREWGAHLVGELLPDYQGFRAQRVTVHSWRRPPKDSVWRYQPHSWFDETKPDGQQNTPGWSVMEFTGNIKLDLRVGRTGVRVAYPNGHIDPPPPPDKIDMLELMAPASVDFAKTRPPGGKMGMMSTVRDDSRRVFVVVKGAVGKSWDWFYWDDEFIYHVITEDGDKDDPTAFKSHAAPGVKWCRRFATLGEKLVSGPVIHRWANCVQGPEHSLQEASTQLHSRAYTAGELGMASADLPGSTICYRLDWRWGPNPENLETFTYAVGWGHLDWDCHGYDVEPFNTRSSKPLIKPDFPCFDVADWIDENMRPDDPPPPPTGWYTIETERAYCKFTDATAAQALSDIRAGKNHLSISQAAFLPSDLAKLERELAKITGG